MFPEIIYFALQQQPSAGWRPQGQAGLESVAKKRFYRHGNDLVCEIKTKTRVFEFNLLFERSYITLRLFLFCMYMVIYSSYNIYATCYTNMLSEFGKKVEDLKGKLSVEGLLKYI